MKTKTIMLALGCLMAFMMQSCAHLEELEDCNAQAFFETETEPDCPAPCEVRFINSSIGRYSSVRWTLGDNSPAVEEDGTFTHTYDTAGEYNVVLTVFADGCPPVERTGSVLIGVSAPIPRFTADTNRCTLVREDCTINFINHSENSDRYEWYVDGVLKGQSENFTHTFTEADTFTVSLAAFNKEVRRDASAVIIIRPLTFKIKGYDLDNDASEGEAIYGVDEAGSGGYYLMMNNNIACYMAITDVFGELDPASVIGRDLGPNYSLIQPNTFVKAPNGYLLAGRAVRTNFNYDLFVFRATSAFNFAGIKTFFEPFEGANEDAYGGAATDAGNYLLFGQGTIDGQQGAYLAEVNTSLTSLVSGRLILDPSPVATGYAIVNVDGGYWLAGVHQNASGANEAFFVRLDDSFNQIGGPINIGSQQFSAKKIIPLNTQSAIIIGNEGSTARAARVDIGTTGVMTRAWQEPYPGWEFRDGLLASGGRLIVAGAATATNDPGWLEINPVDGKKYSNHQSYTSNLMDDGAINSIAETRDGGFILAGSGRKTGADDFSILIKTDRNGVVDEN